MVFYRESVDVNNLGVGGYRICRRLNAKEIDIKEERVRLYDDFVFNCFLTGNRYKVQANGDIGGMIKMICDRCNIEYDKRLYAKFNLTYLPMEFCPSEKEEHRLTAKDLDISYYKDDKIEIHEIIREQIYLMIPIKSLCKEDCKGLCSGCGVNLNYERCNCKEQIDERWEKLREFLPFNK